MLKTALDQYHHLFERPDVLIHWYYLLGKEMVDRCCHNVSQCFALSCCILVEWGHVKSLWPPTWMYVIFCCLCSPSRVPASVVLLFCCYFEVSRCGTLSMPINCNGPTNWEQEARSQRPVPSGPPLRAPTGTNPIDGTGGLNRVTNRRGQT